MKTLNTSASGLQPIKLRQTPEAKNRSFLNLSYFFLRLLKEKFLMSSNLWAVTALLK